MRILVVGDGKVGHTVAEQLTREGHDVVIIDKNEDVLQRCEDTLDVLCIRGNGANARTLLDAGVEKADFVVAATASDETNMLCCLIAKRLGARYTIARIRDPEYNESLSLLQRETSIDNAINPERATALEISRLLRFPFANNIETFAKGQIEMVEFRVQENDVVVGCPLHALSSRLPGIPRAVRDCRTLRRGHHPQRRFRHPRRRPGARCGRYGDDYELFSLPGQALPAREERHAAGRRAHQLLSGEDDCADGDARRDD